MASVLFKRGNTATISSTAIADGQLLWNTVTGEIWEDIGTSRIACGKTVTNTLAEVLAITAGGVSCGTKPVKELNDKIGAWVDIQGEVIKVGDGVNITIDYALYNPATKEVRISMRGNAAYVADGHAVLELPTMYRPTSQIIIGNSQSAKRGTVLATDDYVNGSTLVTTTGKLAPSFELATGLYYLRANFSYIVR